MTPIGSALPRATDPKPRPPLWPARRKGERAGEHDGNRIWLSRGVDGDSICIVVDYGDTDYDATACGGPSGGTAVKALAGQKYLIVPDEYRDQVLPNIAAVG